MQLVHDASFEKKTGERSYCLTEAHPDAYRLFAAILNSRMSQAPPEDIPRLMKSIDRCLAAAIGGPVTAPRIDEGVIRELKTYVEAGPIMNAQAFTDFPMDQAVQIADLRSRQCAAAQDIVNLYIETAVQR